MNKFLTALLVFCLLLQINIYAQTPGTPCDSIANIAYKVLEKRDYVQSINVLESLLKVCSRDTGMSDFDYYSALGYLAFSYYEVGQEDSCINKGEPAIRYFKKINYSKESIYPSLLVRLGYCYVGRSWFPEAIDKFETALPLYKKFKGESSQEYLTYAMELASCYSALNDYRKSSAILRQLKEIILKNQGKKSAAYVSLITNMGNDFAYQGIDDSALVYHTESLQLREELFGKNHTEYAKGLGNVGAVYKSMNRISDALLLLEQARSIYVTAKADKTADYAATMYQLGQLYLELENLSKAESFLAEALNISIDNLGYYHPQIAMIYSSIGSLFSDLGKYQDAVKFYLRSKNILEYTTGDSTSSYATVINNLGLAYSDIPKYDSAVFFLKKSLALKEIIFGKAAYSTFSTLSNLGSVSFDMGSFKDALNYYNQSKKIVSDNYGNDHYNIAGINGNIALALHATGDIKNADNLLQETFNIRKKYILNFTEGLSESERYSYSSSMKADTYMGMNFRRNTALKNDWLYNSSIFYKGMLLEGSRGLISAFNKFTDPLLKKKAEEYLALKSFIGKEFLKQASERSKNLTELFNRAENIERELMNASASYRNWKQILSTDWKQVQSKLQPGDAAIEFITYCPYDKKDKNVYYAALVVTKESPTPELVQLFTENGLNKLLTAKGDEAIVKKLYRSTIKGSTSAPTASDSLYHIIWKPLMPSIKSSKRLFFSADGVLNKLNLAAIITPDGKRLLENYEFIQLASTRTVSDKTVAPSFSNMQLWGGINYDLNTTSTTDKTFSYLPGTLSEVNDISSFASNASKKINLKLSSDANETSFKQLNGKSPEVLHIATHGFFFPDPTSSKKAGNRFESSFDPLLRSGLALAGANHHWNSDVVSSDKEDGILTAYEISTMDLSNTKLVVLSACETGLGDVQSGEGVYGLQRAFKLAGVDQMIMSLWQVPDLETKEFMQTFYANCFRGMPVRKAFRETQLEMNKKYQPYQWAAFVLIE